MPYVVALSRAPALEEARCGITVKVASLGLLKDESGDKVAAPPMRCSATACRWATPATRRTSCAPSFSLPPPAHFVTGQVVEVAGGARL